MSHSTPHLTLVAVLAAVAAVAAISSVAACEPPLACDLSARASLSVHVEDSAGTGIDDATVTARPDADGAAFEACETLGAGDYLCPFFEVAGDFVVTASRPGFVDATVNATWSPLTCCWCWPRLTARAAAPRSSRATSSPRPRRIPPPTAPPATRAAASTRPSASRPTPAAPTPPATAAAEATSVRPSWPGGCEGSWCRAGS